MIKFSVSVKGVLKINNKFLLRKNERGEFELLGGRLEKHDISFEQRLKTEFLEESGIDIKVLDPREPWIYDINNKKIIIMPFVCSHLNIPDKLEDTDGGTLHWINSEQINDLLMPQGYKDTISGVIPENSRSNSNSIKPFFKIIPDYIEYKYCVKICVLHDEKILFCKYLDFNNYSIQNFIYENLGRERIIKFHSGEINNSHDTVILNYII